jgi:tubulin polyglutamylase TTLL6/13
LVIPTLLPSLTPSRHPFSTRLRSSLTFPVSSLNQLTLIECTYDIVRDVSKVDLGWRVTRNENFNSEWDVYFADLGIDSEHLAQMKPYQKINHFPAMYLIARKTFLGKNLKKLSRLCPDDYQFYPKTWILP